MSALDNKVLQDFSLAPCQNFINNAYHKGQGPVLTLVNAKDNSPLPIKAVSASAEEVDLAVSLARRQFEEGEWSQWTGLQRARALNKLADLIEENAEVLKYLESVTSGRPLGTLDLEITRTVNTFRYYAGWADKLKGDSFPPEDGFYKIVRQEPLGVCCGITAWNASLMFAAWKSAPALATGNCMILKPSEKSFIGTLALAQLYKAAGFPPGVFQVLIGGGDVGSILSSHMDIDKVSFTGSTLTGRRIQEAAAKSNLKRVTLELGGKGPAIVFDDADFDTALFWIQIGFTANMGQICAATTRLLLHESIFDAFLVKLRANLAPFEETLGADPQDKTTTYGPLIDKAQFDKVRTYIEEGKKAGEVLVADRGDPNTKGFYVAPTVFLNPSTDSKVWKEEIFGPVLCVRSFKDEKDAIRQANDTSYGLNSAVFTTSISRALRVASSVRTGTVGINCNLLLGEQAPMGGFKTSGIGRELGEYGLASYTEAKTIWINMS